MFYHVQVHQRIPREEGTHFLQEVDGILQDPRGWDVQFTRVPLRELLTKPKKDAFIIRLTPSKDLYALYPDFQAQQLSVADMGERTIDINHCRWTEECPNNSQLTLPEYRRYVVLHEVGHMLGKQHPDTLPDQEAAPVMMQQTLGIQHYKANPWPTTFDKFVL